MDQVPATREQTDGVPPRGEALEGRLRAPNDLGVALPGANSKVEGALVAATPVGSAGASLTLGPDGFFDGAIFDPDRVSAYIDGQQRTLAGD